MWLAHGVLWGGWARRKTKDTKENRKACASGGASAVARALLCLVPSESKQDVPVEDSNIRYETDCVYKY
jgi:hypothetical protein